jgi:hypothetical protein
VKFSDLATAALSAALVVPAPLLAGDTNLSATDTLIIEARTDNANGSLGDDHYGIVINRLNLNGNAGDISSQVRIDSFYLTNFCKRGMWDYVPSDANNDGFSDAFDYGTFDQDGAFVSETDDGMRDGIDLTGDGRPNVSDVDQDGFADVMPRNCVPIPLRGAGAPDTLTNDGYTWRYRNDVVLERINIAYRRGDFTITAGDYFQQLGRGIVLAVRKVDEAGLDLSLQGGQLEYRGDDHRLTTFAGRTNPANLDSINRQYVRRFGRYEGAPGEPVGPVEDIVAGYDYQLRAIDGVRVNLYGAYLEIGERLFLDERDYNLSQGLSVELPSPTDWLTVYGEFDVQERVLGGDSTTGLAGYLTTSFNVKDFSVLLEGLYLNDFNQDGSGNSALSGASFAYNQAPTLERIDQETLNSSTVLGGRVRAEQYFFEADTNVYVSGNLLLNNRGDAGELRQMHGYAGVKTYYQAGQSRIELSGGYRDETNTNLPDRDLQFATVQQGHVQLKSIRHAELDWLQSLGNGYSLHLASTNEFRELSHDPYQRGSTFLGVDRVGLGGLTFEFGYDTQLEGDNIRNFFFAGIVKWETADWLTLSATVGTQRGGIKCINGVCREYPAFAGGQLVAVGRW